MRTEASQMALKWSNQISAIEACYFLIMIYEIKKLDLSGKNSALLKSKYLGVRLCEISRYVFLEYVQDEKIIKRRLSIKWKCNFNACRYVILW